MKSDIEWIQELIEKAKDRELGINSISYYYALKHLLELCPDGESVNTEDRKSSISWCDSNSGHQYLTFPKIML